MLLGYPTYLSQIIIGEGKGARGLKPPSFEESSIGFNLLPWKIFLVD